MVDSFIHGLWLITYRLPYTLHRINILKDTQKEAWYSAINPNGRIPAITDSFTDGKPIRLFESGAIQKYLVERYDTEHKISYPPGTREYHEMNCWVRCPDPFEPCIDANRLIQLFYLNAGVGCVTHSCGILLRHH